MMLTPFALKGFALAVSVLFVVSTTVAFAEDTGIVVRENGINRGSIYWWDDDSLLVAGVHSEHPPKDNSGWRLLRFKVSDKSVTDMGQVGALCASNGHLRVSRLSADSVGKAAAHWKFVLYSGSIDQLVEDPPRPIPPPSANPPSFNALSNCKFPDELPPAPAWLESAKKSGRVFRALKPEHGWLEMFAGDPNYSQQMTYPLAIHPPGKEDKPIAIDKRVFQPWLDQSYHVRFVRYEAFKNAYLLALDDTSGRGRDNGSFWWLYPDGTTEQILTYGRSGNWEGVRLNGVIPIKNGLLAFSGDTRVRTDKSGLYRKSPDGELDLVARGWGGGYSVSPDGCMVAFGIDPRGFRIEGPRRLQLHVLNACN